MNSKVQSGASQISPAQVFIWGIVAIALLLSPFIGYQVSTTSYQLVILIVGGLVAFCWTIFAGHSWWVPFPAALAFGGTFYVGFKIPAHEMALLVCTFPLILNLCVRYSGVIRGRTTLPASVFLLTIYIFAHWIGSLSYNTFNGLGGHGNVTRSYMNAAWPFILFFFFYYFGRSDLIRSALGFMFASYLIRVGLGLWDYFDPGMRYIPGINFVLPATSAFSDGGGSGDLRNSAPNACLLAICYICLSRGFLRKSFFFCIVVATCGITALGGGRIAILYVMCILLGSALLYRRFIWIILITTLLAAFVLLLNIQKSIIYVFPEPMQRSLSVLVFEKGSVDAHEGTELSDKWHGMLQKAGYERWTESVGSILFGHGLRPFDPGFFDKNAGGMEYFYFMVKVATQTASFEAGLWTVLAVFGLTGLILYLNVFRFLLADALPNLWRNKICDYNHAFYFLASYHVITWVVFCSKAGTYPSTALMFALFAKTAHDDEIWRNKNPSTTTTNFAPILKLSPPSSRPV
jgi:hypothetical protein